MMPSTKVSEGQTLLDIALQATGDLTRVFEIAGLNGIDITTDLTIGSTLVVPEPLIDKTYLVDLFTPVYRKPKSADNDIGQTKGREGIGFWIIGDDFVVQ
jgi:hypothetical protein